MIAWLKLLTRRKYLKAINFISEIISWELLAKFAFKFNISNPMPFNCSDACSSIRGCIYISYFFWLTISFSPTHNYTFAFHGHSNFINTWFALVVTGHSKSGSTKIHSTIQINENFGYNNSYQWIIGWCQRCRDKFFNESWFGSIKSFDCNHVSLKKFKVIFSGCLQLLR